MVGRLNVRFGIPSPDSSANDCGYDHQKRGFEATTKQAQDNRQNSQDLSPFRIVGEQKQSE
jgi:hypothetical protein